MGEIIAIAMQKGGVGKTTTTINLAAALVQMGKRVLAVDLDPQGNLTEHAGLNPETLSPTLYHLFREEIEGNSADPRTAIVSVNEGFDLLPAQPELSLIEMALINALSRERILSAILAPLKPRYDYILLDCNPSLGLLVVNALTSADSVLIPIQTEFLAARGAGMILNTIETIRKRKLNPDLRVRGLVLTMADPRTTITRDVIEAVKEQFGDQHFIFETVIKRSVRFAESAVQGKSILAYEPTGASATSYCKLAKEVIHGQQVR